MTRTRSIGGLACLIAAASLVAGCGGGGYTAAESSPTGTPPPATTTSAAPAAGSADAATAAIGAVPPEDPATPQASFAGYQRFPQSRAGAIFIDPTPKPPAPAASPATAPPTPVAGLPTGPTIPSTSTTPTTTTPAPAATQMVATLDISGTSQTVKVGDQVPPDTKLFTVQSIATSKVTLKVNSGTLPGGGTTVDIAVGQSVTLSNPSTGANYTIKVVEVKQTTA